MNQAELIESVIAEDIRDGIINGAAVYAGTLRNDLYRRGFGFAENRLIHPMSVETVVDVASVTKVAALITALLICRSRNLIDFDAPMTAYLPDLEFAPPFPVRVRDLANHTSGFSDPPGAAQRLYFAESGTQILRNVLTTPPPFPPSSTAQYACWNYILLTMILERVAGQAFAEFCREEIFLPLEMHDSSLGRPVAVAPERLAQTIMTEAPGQISDFIAQRIYRDGGSTGNAGLFSTAVDLAKLLRCYLRHGNHANGRLFSEEAFAEIKPDRSQKYDGYRRFGWIIYDRLLDQNAYGNSLFHSGWTGQTVLINFASEFFGVVLTTRRGDYERAKADRFAILNALMAMA